MPGNTAENYLMSSSASGSTRSAFRPAKQGLFTISTPHVAHCLHVLIASGSALAVRRFNDREAAQSRRRRCRHWAIRGKGVVWQREGGIIPSKMCYVKPTGVLRPGSTPTGATGSGGAALEPLPCGVPSAAVPTGQPGRSNLESHCVFVFPPARSARPGAGLAGD